MHKLIFKQRKVQPLFCGIYKTNHSLDRLYSQVLTFRDIREEHFPQVGEKNEILSRIYNQKNFVKVPNAFCLTKELCLSLLYQAELPTITSNVKELVSSMGNSELKAFILEKFKATTFPKSIHHMMEEYYQELEKEYGSNCPVVIKSNVSEEHDFEPYYKIQKFGSIVEHLKSKLREIYFNVCMDTVQSKVISEKVFHNISLTVQKMIESTEYSSSGIMYNVDFTTGFRNSIEILSNFGFCDEILDADHYMLYKPNLGRDIEAIIEKTKGSKSFRSVLERSGLHFRLHKIKNSVPLKNKFCLSNQRIVELAQKGKFIESLYSKNVELKIKWAIDPKTNEMYILNVKELKDISRLCNENWITEYHLLKNHHMEEIAHGDSISDQITSGFVLNMKRPDRHFKPGRILVTNETTNQWNPIIKNSKGLITQSEYKFSHAPIFTKSFGIPCIFDVHDATNKFKNNMEITMDGTTGKIYRGKLDYKVEKHDLFLTPNTETKIKMKIDKPEEAFKYSFIPNSGVGMLKIERILKRIGVHPMALLHQYRLGKRDQIKLNQITSDYSDKKEFFVEKLSNGIAMVCAAFYPKPVTMCFSDLNSKEYSKLFGGDVFETLESNPTLGLRGCERYLDPIQKESFKLECEAVRRVREKMKFDNLQLIIPMCRTVEMGAQILEELKLNGLEKSESLQIYLICELPTHIFQLDKYLEMFDGYCIGTNDLTQMILGIDKSIKSVMISKIYDDKNSLIHSLISDVIQKVLKKEKYINICGDAVSNHPDFTEFLIENDIRTVTINPNAMIKSIRLISEKEKLIMRIFSKNPEAMTSS